MKKIILFPLLFSTLAFAENSNIRNDNKKLADDPTRITTKIGLSYSDNYNANDPTIKFSGSIALDPARKINVSLNDEASEWRVGGSWLFDIGIVNFNFGKNEYENGANQTNYSVGTFVPLSYFGVEPMGIQIFPMAGYSYNDGESPCNVKMSGSGCENQHPTISDDYVMVSSQSHGGYLGALALKPLTQSITMIFAGGGSIGSNDYSGYWYGGGLGYSITERHSVSANSFLMDNSFAQETKFSFGYKYQF